MKEGGGGVLLSFRLYALVQKAKQTYVLTFDMFFERQQSGGR